MPSVLHLLGSVPDEQTRQIQSLLVREIGSAFQSSTLKIGIGGNFRDLPTAVLQLRRQKPDITFAWGVQALTSAVLAGHRCIFFTPEVFAGPRALRWIRPVIERGRVTMICPTFTQQRLAVSSGIDPTCCRVIQPGVDFGAIRASESSALRSELGFAGDDSIIIAPGESTIASGHDQAVWTTGILHVLSGKTRLLLWGRGPRAEAMAQLGRRLKQPTLVTLAEPKLRRAVRFEELLSIADICLVTPPGAATTLPIATAMAAGVPIVSTVTYMLAELLEDRHTALMVPNRSPRALAQRVLDLRANSSLRLQLIQTARAEAYEHFSMTRMMEAYRETFRRHTDIR